MAVGYINLNLENFNVLEVLALWLGLALALCIIVHIGEISLKYVRSYWTCVPRLNSRVLLLSESDSSVVEYIPEKQDNTLDHGEWYDLDELIDKSLWHQLTLRLLKVVTSDVFQGDSTAKKLFHKYIWPHHQKMNPLLLAEILMHLVNEYNDEDEAVAILEKIETSVDYDNNALALCKLTRGGIMLDVKGDVIGAKLIVDDVKPLLEDGDQGNFVHGYYHRLNSSVLRLRHNYAEAYREGLRFLCYTDLGNLQPEERIDLATKLIVTGVAGHDVYDLGQLLMHPILDDVKELAEYWQMEMLTAVNEGNVMQLELLTPKMKFDPILASNIDFIRRKTRLLCLMQLCLSTTRTGRRLPMRDIANVLRIPLNAVELLLMKALSLELIRGKIDQVDGTIEIDWVRPRILNQKQLQPLIARLDAWCKNLEEGEIKMQKKVDKLITA